ncbi:MAG: NAD(P)-dependent oxidoreductase [Chloroflexota bacterium]
MKEKILLDPAFRRMANIFSDEDLARIHAVADVIWAQDEQMPTEQLEAIREDIVAIITGNWRHGDVTRFPKLRAILEVGGGFPSPDSLDYAHCFVNNIYVLSCAPAFGPAVAEMALGLTLACSRQIAWTDRAFRAGGSEPDNEPNWSHTEFATEIGDTFTLFGRQVGFIGFGGLAQALRPLLEPFGCPIQVYDPWLTDTYLHRQGVEPVDLETLLSTSRVIYVLAVPSSGNKAMLDREKLELIREDAIFLLMSRAHVVDFDALTDLLAQGRFRAGIDVFPKEPLELDHPIRKIHHAVLSSHRAGAMDDSIRNVGTLVADDIEAICQGLIPQAMQMARPEFIRLRG